MLYILVFLRMKDTKNMAYDHKILDLRYRIDKLVPEVICKNIIDIFEKYPKYHDVERSYKFKSNKYEIDNFTCMNLSMIENPNQDILYAFNQARNYISIVIANYILYVRNKICPTFNNKLIVSTRNIRILKYEKGQLIKDHTDVGDTIRASCTLNLNDDYEGGEFRFFDGQVKESFKTGDAMLFPAEPIWIHGTEPITKGTRYCINCFLHK